MNVERKKENFTELKIKSTVLERNTLIANSLENYYNEDTIYTNVW